MDQPLGRAVGNALEVREALDTVRGDGPADFTELVLERCAHLLALSDLEVDEAEGRRLAEQAVADGSAELSGSVDRGAGRRPDEGRCPLRRWCERSLRHRPAYVSRLGATDRRGATLHLGAGRMSKEDEIDHAVGVVCHRKRGDAVEEGDVLAEVHARDDASAAAGVEEVLAAYEIGDEAPAARPLVSTS